MPRTGSERRLEFMAKKKLWFGYLEAGERSSPVVRDTKLDTGRASTIYLFNLMKGRIIEYQRDIVELKLRDLTVEESVMVEELRRQYITARESFTPRSESRPKMTVPRRRKAPEFDFPDVDDDPGFPLPDDDLPDFEMADELS
jgi:hypothetical protein